MTTTQASQVETAIFRPIDELDPAKVADFLARERAELRRSVRLANSGKRAYRDFAGWTEEQIEACAQSMLRVYSGSLRKMVQIG